MPGGNAGCATAATQQEKRKRVVSILLAMLAPEATATNCYGEPPGLRLSAAMFGTTAVAPQCSPMLPRHLYPHCCPQHRDEIVGNRRPVKQRTAHPPSLPPGVVPETWCGCAHAYSHPVARHGGSGPTGAHTEQSIMGWLRPAHKAKVLHTQPRRPPSLMHYRWKAD